MSSALPTSTQPVRIGDLVAVRAHPTVVRLDHLDSPDAGWITAAYHLTPAVAGHLAAMQRALAQATGCGMFLIGQYGSGKSHLLAYVVQAVRAGTLPASARLDVVALSLLNYRGTTPLEDIVCGALGLEAGAGDRRLGWQRAADAHPSGLLLVLDELSEFLRSKPDPRSFTEDVRFLQFLGEWTAGQRFWVLASLQEQIEHTGDLDYSLYRKIKDRYPLRFLLTPAHVRDLIRDAILIKREGYDAAVERVLEETRAALPQMPLCAAELRALYPIHPATLDLLEEVRDRFSQARGIVDFAVTRLAGSPTRGVAPFLDRPWGDFLTPEAIVDHFRDLLELQAEFVPLAQQLLPFYERAMPELFGRPALAELAGRVLKLLALAYLSPARNGITVDDAAFWLLYRPSRLDAQKNLAVLRKVLDKLVADGRYVVQDGDRFRLDFRVEDAALLDKQLAHERLDLARADPELVFEQIAPALEGTDFNPLTLPQHELEHRVLRWHFHERRFAVWLGSADPPPAKAVVLCLRLPWGEAQPAPGAHTLVPKPLPLDERHRELAALRRVASRPWSEATAAKIATRIEETGRAFAADVKAAYLEAALFDPTGGAATPAPVELRLRFEPWLDRQAEHVFRRLLPSFERFAPGHGPLPKEVYRALVRFALDHDLGEPEADDAVRLVREAYFVPMGLLIRVGRGYAVPKALERHELVRLVLPLLEHEPLPRVVLDHLAQPVYGLVPDQVRVLLLSLLLQGEIDLHKDGKSYRELYEMTPDPLLYDRIVPGRRLGPDQLRSLEQLCEGLGVRLQSQGTALAQRQAVERLREKGQAFAAALQPLLLQVQGLPQGASLTERVRGVLATWRLLSEGGDELVRLQRFLDAAAPVRRFLDTLAELRELPGRLDRLLAETQRLSHLLAHTALTAAQDPALAIQIEALGAPPALDRLDELDRWLAGARAVYDAYCLDYARRHDAAWRTLAAHPVWSWQPPAIAKSRHLDLEREREALGRARARAEQLRCRGPAKLQFQPLCSCGFGAAPDPLQEELQRFAGAKERIEAALAEFFGQSSVKHRLHEWLEQGLGSTAGVAAYVAGERPFPEVDNLELFDRHLAGVELVRSVRLDELVAQLEGRTWEVGEAVVQFERVLRARREPRVRFTAERGTALGDEIAVWCVRQALRSGVPLPGGLSPALQQVAAERLEPRDVSQAALPVLEGLGLDDALVAQVLRWLLDGAVSLPPDVGGSRLLLAVRELLTPKPPAHAADLARGAAELYGAHPRLRSVGGSRWLSTLDAMATATLTPAPPALADVLRQQGVAQWLVIDCLGVALLPALHTKLEQILAAWCLTTTTFALVSPETTTKAWLRGMTEAGLVQRYEKIDAVDALIHERPLALDDLARVAAAELDVACRVIVKRLDVGLPLVVFADHGFRLAADGRSFRHGGASMLERLVPVLLFAARGGLR